MQKNPTSEGWAIQLCLLMICGVFIIFTKATVAVNKRTKEYLKSLIGCLFKWRLNMNVTKCCYTIFLRGGRNGYKVWLPNELKTNLIFTGILWVYFWQLFFIVLFCSNSCLDRIQATHHRAIRCIYSLKRVWPSTLTYEWCSTVKGYISLAGVKAILSHSCSKIRLLLF